MGKRDTLILAICTLLTAAAWIAFDLYHASVDTTISPEDEALLVPITPTFDRSVLEKIKSRQHIEPLEAAEASGATESGGR